jgi:cyanate permease
LALLVAFEGPGFMNMGGRWGGALTASLTPMIAQRYGWTSSFLIAAIVSGVRGLAWLLVEPDRRLALQENRRTNTEKGGNHRRHNLDASLYLQLCSLLVVRDVEHQPSVAQTKRQDVAVIDGMTGGVQGTDLKI